MGFYSNPDLEDGFGSLAGGRKTRHSGLDFPHKAGEPIPALYGGTVVENGYNGNLGNYIQIRADFGKVFTYAHGIARSPLNVGQFVQAGNTIMKVGATGYASGPHLHLSVGDTLAVGYGVCEDPFPYLTQRPALDGNRRVSGVIRSGADWSFVYPQGELAKFVASGLILKGRLPDDYKNDGDPGPVFEIGVQRTLNFSGAFAGDEDGRIERGGCEGIQRYAAWYGNYDGRGGIHDRKLGPLSWECFGNGLRD